jgi:hypothetical protein
MLERWRRLYGHLTLRLLWDLFMVWVALINLGLIVFDMTYLWLRPVYFEYLPVVTRIYDPVKGIEPHPLTEQFLEDLNAAERLAELAPGSPQLDERLDALQTLTRRILLENPFERSGLGHNLELLKQSIAHDSGIRVTDLEDPETINRAIAEVWSGSPSQIRVRLERIDTQLRPLLRENYFREFDRNGHLVDHFWMLDLPFLILFWVEFMVRWTLEIRRRTYARWFFFPIFNWYDVLGLVPVAYLRVFRLLRLASMYMRLRRSQLSVVGKDVISRSVAYLSNIITEEVSDRVALRILEEFAEEIQDGTHRRIVQDVVGTRRGEIESVLAEQVRGLLTDDEILASLRSLLRLNLDNAVDRSEALQSVPLPNAVMRPIVRGVGEVVLDATLETVRTTLETPEGRDAVQAVATAAVQHLFDGVGVEQIEILAREISLNVIDHMKATVAVKKWALPEAQRRPHSLAEALGDIAEAAPETGNAREAERKTTETQRHPEAQSSLPTE